MAPEIERSLTCGSLSDLPITYRAAPPRPPVRIHNPENRPNSESDHRECQLPQATGARPYRENVLVAMRAKIAGLLLREDLQNPFQHLAGSKPFFSSRRTQHGALPSRDLNIRYITEPLHFRLGPHGSISGGGKIGQRYRRHAAKLIAKHVARIALCKKSHMGIAQAIGCNLGNSRPQST
jgi:hypothetical protein